MSDRFGEDLVKQLCDRLAEKLAAEPTAGLNDLIQFLANTIEVDLSLKQAFREKARQINQGDATGYQVLVEGGQAYIGQHLHVSDPSLVERAIDTILKGYLSQPVGTPSNLPLSGVAKFVGREQAMTEIAEKLRGGQQVAISSVSGMGGVGKTELALQYAYRHLATQTYPGGICWINARSQEMGIALLDFARIQLGLPEPPDTLETVPQRVAWVCGRWQGEPILVVLDDVVDYGAVKPYLDKLDRRFRVLMTTRLKLGTLVQRLELEVLTEAAALELLRVLVNDPGRIDDHLAEAKALCEWLGYLPLGLELVGRYLAKKTDLSLGEMRERLAAKKLAAAALVQAEEMTAQRGVAAAFELSWEELPPEAQTLCGVLSIFALAPIPWGLVEQCLPDWDPEDLEDCRDNHLMGRNLLARVGQKQYELHQLIREFFAAKLNDAPTWQRKVADTLTAVAKTIPPTVTLGDRARVEAVLPHLEIVPDFAHLLEGTDKMWALEGLARVAEAQSLWSAAEGYYKRSLLIREQQLGADHPSTATSLNNLAELYRAQGRYPEAEPLYKRSLSICEQQLGADHPHTASSLNNLAGLYRVQGRYPEAEPLYKRSLLIREQQLGADHPDTATSLNNLAGLYRVQGRYPEAEPLYKRSLLITEQQLGADHPDTAQSLNNLAGLYESQGRYPEAEPLYARSVVILLQALGQEHPNTQSGINNFVGCLQQALAAGQGDSLSDHPLTQQLLEQLRKE